MPEPEGRGGPVAPPLRCHEVSVALGGRPVLEGVSLALQAGEVLALCGPNGAGKSTLLRVLAGNQPVDAGGVECQGQPLGSLTVRERARRMAVVPQELLLSFPFSVTEVVLMGRAPYLGTLGIEGAADLARVESALARTDCSHLASQAYTTLSGGERQRVLLAKALVQETPVLLLDEPTAHLDLRHQLVFIGLCRELCRAGVAVLTVVHDLNLAVRLADRLALLRAGRLSGVGTPLEVLTRARLRQVFDADFHVGEAADGKPFYVPLAAGGLGGGEMAS